MRLFAPWALLSTLVCVTGLAVIPAAIRAQAVVVSGRVVEQGSGRSVGNATVRLTGADPVVTDSAGHFGFPPLIPGRMILTVSSIGFQFRSIEIVATSDTSVTIALAPRIATLDTVIVRPGRIRIRGTAVDSATGDDLLQAQATLYPGGRFVGAMNGTFTFDSVAPGLVTIVVEGFEHLPVRLDFEATRDTTFRVELGIDSVAVRMIALQVTRLHRRAQSVPYTMRAYNRVVIAEQPTMSIGEFIDRKLMRLPDPGRRASASAFSGCIFVDDMRVEPGRLDGTPPELVERVEVYRNGGMVRVYTKRYVASLIGKTGLQKTSYMPIGTMTTSPSCR